MCMLYDLGQLVYSLVPFHILDRLSAVVAKPRLGFSQLKSPDIRPDDPKGDEIHGSDEFY